MNVHPKVSKSQDKCHFSGIRGRRGRNQYIIRHLPSRLNRVNAISILAMVICMITLNCGSQQNDVPPPKHAPIQFEEISTAAGLSFNHFPAQRQSLLPEDMGSGLAWGDYDDDGDPDLFIVNFGGPILEPIGDAKENRCALYRNDGKGTFTDVSDQSGMNPALYGMAAAWGDYDSDGDLDLYITAYGPNILYRNEGNGRFVDVTAMAGLQEERFSSGCSWADFDLDGDLDLYVCSYVQFEYRESDRGRTIRQYGSDTPATLNPSTYRAELNALYRNNGDGTFNDIALSAGVLNAEGRSLGCLWVDLDNDGLLDLYVANDMSANGVYRNLGNATFEDISASSLGDDRRGAMGMALHDIDHDADLDLFITHWAGQHNALFENNADAGVDRLIFLDTAFMLGLGAVSLNKVGWATGFTDFDNDGGFDLWVVNGHTIEDGHRLRPQGFQLFRRSGSVFATFNLEGPMATPIVGRGGASADFDGDGRMDLAILVHGGSPLLLRNVSPQAGNWLQVRLRQQRGNTSAIGATVLIEFGEQRRLAQVGTGVSYLSQNQNILHFGLGTESTVSRMTITWPDGTKQIEENVPANQHLTISRTDF